MPPSSAAAAAPPEYGAPADPRDVRFLIIGATKSATTWLQTALVADPAIHMPGPELHFFSRHYDNGMDWYLAQFGRPARGAVAVGEKSNSYLDTAAAAERIARHLPHVRLVVQLRNPIERAYSDYCMLLRRGTVGRDIAAALDPGRGGANRFLEGGRYAEQLARYTALFPAENLHATLYDDVARDPAALVAGVRRFLGVGGPAPALPPAAVKSRRTPVLPAPLRRALAPARPLVDPLRGTPLFRAARAAIAREVRYPPLGPALCARLADYYGAELAALPALIGRDVAGWSAAPPPPPSAAAHG